MTGLLGPLKVTLACAAIALFHPSDTDPLPDLVCRADSKVTTTHATLETRRGATTDVYRFKSGALYISSSDRDEYLYGPVVSTDFRRYTSGYKTILFNDGEYRTGIAVHVDNAETLVLALRCVAT